METQNEECLLKEYLYLFLMRMRCFSISVVWFAVDIRVCSPFFLPVELICIVKTWKTCSKLPKPPPPECLWVCELMRSPHSWAWYLSRRLALSHMAHFVCTIGLADLQWPLSHCLLSPWDLRGAQVHRPRGPHLNYKMWRATNYNLHQKHIYSFFLFINAVYYLPVFGYG